MALRSLWPLAADIIIRWQSLNQRLVSQFTRQEDSAHVLHGALGKSG